MSCSSRVFYHGFNKQLCLILSVKVIAATVCLGGLISFIAGEPLLGAAGWLEFQISLMRD